MREGIFTICRGIGQVMLQNNAWSGAIMLAGIACNSWLLAILAIAGNLTGTLTALLAGYSIREIRDGLYGFNGTLIGIAVGVFFKINLISIVLLIAGSGLSTLIAGLFNRKSKLPGYTAPFIIVIWILLSGCYFLYPSLLITSSAMPASSETDLFAAFCFNLGQVMFQDGSLITGIFFLIAILINSTLDTTYAFIGAALPLTLALIIGTDYTSFNTGVYGYNAVLCSIALADRTKRGAIFAILSILISIGLQITGMNLGITTLTAPFVLSVWIVKLLQNTLSRVHADTKSCYFL